METHPAEALGEMLITNLRHLRRQMQQHADVPPHLSAAIDELITSMVREKPRDLSELYQALPEVQQALVDARLGHMRADGIVIIELERNLYGPRTIARAA